MGNFWTLVLAMPKIWRLLRRPISTGNSIRGLSLSTSTFRLARMFWCLRSQPEFLQCCYESSGAQSGEDSLKTVQETSITDYCSDLFPKDLPWPRTIRTQSHHRLSEFIPLLEVWFQYGSYDKILIFCGIESASSKSPTLPKKLDLAGCREETTWTCFMRDLFSSGRRHTRNSSELCFPFAVFRIWCCIRWVVVPFQTPFQPSFHQESDWNFAEKTRWNRLIKKYWLFVMLLADLQVVPPSVNKQSIVFAGYFQSALLSGI